MKRCSVCEALKEESLFQVRKASPDGRTSACKSCLSIRDKNRDNEKRKAARLSYQKSDAGKVAHGRACKSYAQNNPIRRSAQIAVSNAVRDGLLVKPNSCECCGGNEKIEGHHDDYTKKLIVRWLCETCHKKWHKLNKPLYGD